MYFVILSQLHFNDINLFDFMLKMSGEGERNKPYLSLYIIVIYNLDNKIGIIMIIIRMIMPTIKKFIF